MFRYILLATLTFFLSGCVEKRVIKVTTVDRTSTAHRQVAHQTRHRVPRRDREERVKEEILIRNNPNLGEVRQRVLVPKNRPTLDVNLSLYRNINRPKSLLEARGVENRPKRVVKRIPFPQEEYRNLPKFGENEVSGRIYLIDSTTGEEIVKGNLKLYLNPVTSYSRQWYEESYLNGNKMTPPDKRLFNYLRFTISDSSGNFSFFGVPAGSYYLGAKIECDEGCGSSSQKVIRVVKEIYVDGNLRDIELSKSIP